MIHSFTVFSATYDGTYPAAPDGRNNPIVYILGSVDGARIGALRVFWDLIQTANLIGGAPAVQSQLGPYMMGVFSFQPYPVPPALPPVIGVIPQPVTGSRNSEISVPEALVGSWTQ